MVERSYKRRTDLHLTRKAWHMGGVLLIALVHQRVTKETSILLLVANILVFVVPDILRQFSPRMNQIFVGLFQSVIRQNEVHRLSGNTFLICGVLSIVLLFPPTIVSLTLFFLAFADPIASCIGILYGKDKILGHKSLQGFLAALVVCTFITACYLYIHVLLVDRIVVVSLLAGLIGALSELLPIGKLDDNLTLPLMSATGLYWLLRLFGVSF